MKKIISIIMAFILSISTAGCMNSKIKVEETAKNFMDAYCEFNLKAAFEYLENKEDHELPFETLEGFFETMRASMTEDDTIEGMSSYVDKFIVPLYSKFVESLSYSIEKTEKQEDKFVVSVNLETINAENINTEDINFEEIMSQLATELTENGTLNEDMSQDDFLAIIMEHAPEKMAEKMLSLLENAGMQTIPIKLVLKNVDGTYMITDESDIEKLLSSSALSM